MFESSRSMRPGARAVFHVNSNTGGIEKHLFWHQLKQLRLSSVFHAVQGCVSFSVSIGKLALFRLERRLGQLNCVASNCPIWACLRWRVCWSLLTRSRCCLLWQTSASLRRPQTLKYWCAIRPCGNTFCVKVNKSSGRCQTDTTAFWDSSCLHTFETCHLNPLWTEYRMLYS